MKLEFCSVKIWIQNNWEDWTAYFSSKARLDWMLCLILFCTSQYCPLLAKCRYTCSPKSWNLGKFYENSLASSSFITPFFQPFLLLTPPTIICSVITKSHCITKIIQAYASCYCVKMLGFFYRLGCHTILRQKKSKISLLCAK